MTSHASRPRILVVDDDPSVLRTMGRIFERDHQVELAASGAAALERLPAFPADVAVVDVRMPEMNGLDLMKRLHAVRPDLDVIVVTGTAEEPDANLVKAIDAGAFYFVQKPFDRCVLLTLAARCLELRRLREEKDRYTLALEKELEEARKFQRSLLPAPHARIGCVAVDARYVACRELAGDFYDYAPLGNDAVALVIADVVGHGTSAAMLTSIVKAAFHSAQVDGYDSLSVVHRVMDGLQAFDPSRFITLSAAKIEIATRSLEFAGAGHPPAVLRRRGLATQLLESTGPLICSTVDVAAWDRNRLQLEPGDILLFYTDGVTEAHGPLGMFGMKRLIDVVSRHEHGGSELIDKVFAEVTEFSAGRPVQDDMTLLVAEIGAG